MSFSEQDKQEMVNDGLSQERRDAFRVGRLTQRPKTFEAYIAILDDLQRIAPPPPRPPFLVYRNVKL